MTEVRASARAQITPPQRHFTLRDLAQPSAERCSSTAAQRYRKAYLTALANREVPPLIEVYGQTASGKSTTLQLMQGTLGINPSTRFLTRPPRSDDGWFEKPWIPDRSGAASTPSATYERGSEPLALSPQDTLFAIYNYRNYYGTSASELVGSLISAGEHGVSVLMGKLLDLPNFHEAVSNIFPLFPMVPCRLMVELYQLSDRLERRAATGREARPGEVRERLDALAGKFLEDHAQVGAYCELYNLIPLIAPLQSECERFHITNTQPLTAEALCAALIPSIEAAKERSANLAAEVLRPRILAAQGSVLSPVALTMLQEFTVPQSRRMGISEIYLTGSLGAAVYLADQPWSCQLGSNSGSNRLTLTVPTREDDTTRLSDLLGVLILQSRGDAETLLLGSIPENTTDLRGTSTIHWPEREVTLEARRTTLMPARDPSLCFELRCDHGDQILARSVRLPNGTTVGLMPPEHILVESLISLSTGNAQSEAARSAVGLLSTQPIDINVMHRLIFHQSFDEQLDHRCGATIERMASTGKPVTLREFYAVALPETAKLLELPERFLARDVDLTKSHDSPHDNSATSPLSLSAVKQLAMIAHLSHGLERASSLVANAEAQAPMDEQARRATKRCREQLTLCQRALALWTDFQIGRGDIFVQRDGSLGISQFFSLLPE